MIIQSIWKELKMEFKEIRNKLKTFTLVDDNRLKVIFDKVVETRQIHGVMAEIGVYKGGSSYLIAKTDQYRLLYACDSFEGLPEANSSVDIHHKGEFADVDFDKVKKLLKLPNVKIIKGFFPDVELHAEMTDKLYSFVHVDVDLYQPTLDCLNFFYPRMLPGAVLVSDDYLWRGCPGVKKAFDEFMLDKPEKLVDTGCKSCYFVKQ